MRKLVTLTVCMCKKEENYEEKLIIKMGEVIDEFLLHFTSNSKCIAKFNGMGKKKPVEHPMAASILREAKEKCGSDYQLRVYCEEESDGDENEEKENEEELENERESSNGIETISYALAPKANIEILENLQLVAPHENDNDISMQSFNDDMDNGGGEEMSFDFNFDDVMHDSNSTLLSAVPLLSDADEPMIAQASASEEEAHDAGQSVIKLLVFSHTRHA